MNFRKKLPRAMASGVLLITGSNMAGQLCNYGMGKMAAKNYAKGSAMHYGFESFARRELKESFHWRVFLPGSFYWATPNVEIEVRIEKRKWDVPLEREQKREESLII
jgi:hypothetical protein